MQKRLLLISFTLALLCSPKATSQTKEAGPIIKEYGKVWKIKNPDYPTDTSKEYKVVFDIMNSPESHAAINTSIETAARFLNMHAQAGVPKEQLKVVLVVHNKASKDIITNDAYKKRYGTANPNEEMITSLIDEGVEIVFCGQSSLSRNFPIEDTLDGVQLALSAMTALIQLQNEGYQLIKF
ncbi:MAG: DsrE family protein [Flavobacteriaceae bacterium]